MYSERTRRLALLGISLLCSPLWGCRGIPPADLELPPSPYVQQFERVYMVNNHIEWWQSPFYRLEDDETYPKIVIVSTASQGCILTTRDKGYGEWATLQRLDLVNCPRPWRTRRY